MTAPSTKSRPPFPTGASRSGFARRWAAPIGILVVIVVTVVVTTVLSRSTTTSSSSSDANVPADQRDAPIFFEEARAQGRADMITWVPNCDPATGRIQMPSIYAPPCVPAFSGDNGGNTTIGVTADEIKVVVYQAPPNADLESLLQGLGDDEPAVEETTRNFVELAHALFETYGRRVTFIPLKGSGSDATSAAADAVRVVDEIKPFASLGGPLGTTAYADALSRAGILCINCSVGQPEQYALDHAPFIWGLAASPDQVMENVNAYVTSRLAQRKAEFAGPELASRDRVLGVVHFEQETTVFGKLARELRSAAEGVGLPVAAVASYEFDIARMSERATSIIAQMKDRGVTSIVFVGDPIMPLYLTQAATAQQYFPEWIFTGTAGTDSTVAGRFYDQQQMAHAFGLSSLPVPLSRDQGESWHLHQWFFGAPPAASKTEALIWSPLSFLFTGIHVAGPRLTAATFAAGLFRVPPVGGGPTTPRVSYGNHGLFHRADGSARADYFGVDDMTEIWWDPEARGPDEQGKQGTGMWRYVDGGKRFTVGTMPAEESAVFRLDRSVTNLERPPTQDAPPSYPPPARSR